MEHTSNCNRHRQSHSHKTLLGLAPARACRWPHRIGLLKAASTGAWSSNNNVTGLHCRDGGGQGLLDVIMRELQLQRDTAFRQASSIPAGACDTSSSTA